MGNALYGRTSRLAAYAPPSFAKARRAKRKRSLEDDTMRKAQLGKQIRADKVFDIIVAYKRTHNGNSPSIREIGEAMGIGSTSLIFTYLTHLREEGRIEYDPVISRSITVVGSEWWFAPSVSPSAPGIP